jgi:hypothetical protein
MKLQESASAMRGDELKQMREERQQNFDATMREREQTHTEQQAARDMAAIPAGTPIDDVPENRPLIGRLQMVGGATMEPNQQERPQVDVGPLLPGDQGDAKKRGYLKMASEPQRAAQAAADAKVEAARVATEGRTADNEQRQLDRLAQIKASQAATGPNRALADEMTQLRIQAERDKQEAAKTGRDKTAEGARQSTAIALDLVDRLEKHPGLNKASGIIDSWTSGMSQEATDANGLRDQLVATLTLPNLGTLKGPMSDRDVIFVKQLATRLGNPKLSDTETRKALSEAKTFLQSKSDHGAAGGNSVTAPDGSVHAFDTPAQADAFRKMAGIK